MTTLFSCLLSPDCSSFFPLPLAHQCRSPGTLPLISAGNSSGAGSFFFCSQFLLLHLPYIQPQQRGGSKAKLHPFLPLLALLVSFVHHLHRVTFFLLLLSCVFFLSLCIVLQPLYTVYGGSDPPKSKSWFCWSANSRLPIPSRTASSLCSGCGTSLLTPSIPTTNPNWQPHQPRPPYAYAYAYA